MDDDALNHYLVVQRKFTDEGAKKLIQVYRSTVALVGLGQPDYTGQADGEEPRSTVVNAAVAQVTARATAAAVKTEHRWTLGKDVDAQLTIMGVLRPEHIRRLRQYVDILSDALENDPPVTNEAPE